MKRFCTDKIIGFLSFANSCDAGGFKKFGPREWKSALKWLDDASLAFYFLQKLKETNRADAVPTWVLARLEKDFAANQERTDDMSRRFDFLNCKFSEAGIRYAVVKGFSLVPEFCPDSALRHQSDFDYLVDEQSLPQAQQIVIEAGYIQKEPRSSQESIFVMPGEESPMRGAGQYSARAPHAVELHLDIWDSDAHRLPAIPRMFSPQRATVQHSNGYAFPALTDEDAFLLQVLHALHHVFTYWIRMSCLWEIGFFLNRRASDQLLWNQVDQRIGDNRMLREFVVIITELSAKLFEAPVPRLVQDWGQSITPATRVWIDRYGRDLFCEVPSHEFTLFPKAKLVLFLHQQYEDACAQEHAVRNRLLKFPRVSRIKASLRDKPSLIVNLGFWKEHRVLQRASFQLLSGLRYFCEIPRWRWRTRAAMRFSAPVDPFLSATAEAHEQANARGSAR